MGFQLLKKQIGREGRSGFTWLELGLLGFCSLSVVIFTGLFIFKSEGLNSSSDRSQVIAHIKEVDGESFVKLLGTYSWVPAKKDFPLIEGDALRTGEKSQILIQVDESNILRVESSSYLVLRREADRVQIDLKLGSLIPEVSNEQNVTVTLDERMGARVAKPIYVITEIPMEVDGKIPFDLIEPKEGSTVRLSEKSAPLAPILWTATGGRVKVQVAKDKEFKNVVWEATSETRSVMFEADEKIPSATYYIRAQDLKKKTFTSVREFKLRSMPVARDISPAERLILDARLQNSAEFRWRLPKIYEAEVDFIVDGSSAARKRVPANVNRVSVPLAELNLKPPRNSLISWRIRAVEGSVVGDWTDMINTRVDWFIPPPILQIVNGSKGRMSWRAASATWQCDQPLELTWKDHQPTWDMSLEWSSSKNFAESFRRHADGQTVSFCPVKPGLQYARLQAFDRATGTQYTSEPISYHFSLSPPLLKEAKAYRVPDGSGYLFPWTENVGVGALEVEIRASESATPIRYKLKNAFFPLVLPQEGTYLLSARHLGEDEKPTSDWGALSPFRTVRDQPPMPSLGGHDNKLKGQSSAVYMTGKSQGSWVRLTWQHVLQAVKYQVQVSSGKDFEVVSKNFETPKNEQIVTWTESKEFFWRMRSYDAIRGWSAWSEPQSVAFSRLPVRVPAKDQ